MTDEDSTQRSIEKQVVSKSRVTNFGEVYTSKREVNAMLDLVKQETERIDSRFLEPACGTGNFLVEILERKLRIVKNRYSKTQLEYERNATLAVSSIYGIDIIEDNVIECRKRLFGIFDWDYNRLFGKKAKGECRNTIQIILEQNIIWGDALTLQTVDDNPQPIVFSEWSFPFHNSLLKRRDFTFSDLLPNNKPADLLSGPLLFSDLGKRAFIPKEKKIFPPIHFLRINEGYD